jgi:hypothetical protein
MLAWPGKLGRQPPKSAGAAAGHAVRHQGFELVVEIGGPAAFCDSRDRTESWASR